MRSWTHMLIAAVVAAVSIGPQDAGSPAVAAPPEEPAVEDADSDPITAELTATLRQRILELPDAELVDFAFHRLDLEARTISAISRPPGDVPGAGFDFGAWGQPTRPPDAGCVPSEDQLVALTELLDEDISALLGMLRYSSEDAAAYVAHLRDGTAGWAPWDALRRRQQALRQLLGTVAGGAGEDGR